MNELKKTNIEILRIIAMLMIVAHHYCVHGIFKYWHINSTLTCYLNDVIIGIISMGGKIGVDIFVLITGYFMIASNCKFTKVIKIYLTTLVYSLLFLIIAFLFEGHGWNYVSPKIINTSLFPFGGNAYWFITTYLMLYIFVPYLNKFILTSEKTMLNSLMIITTCLWAIIPTFTNAKYCFSSLLWFMYLYFVGASIRLKTFADLFSNKEFFKKMFILSCIVFTGYAFIKCHGNSINWAGITKLSSLNTIFTLSISIYIFHYFKDLEIGYNKFVNWVSASVLGVYLFHDNNIVRKFLWRRAFHPCLFMDKHYMVLYLLAVVAVVFISGVIIDKLMKLIFEKPINKITEFLSDTYQSKFKKYIQDSGKI